MVFIAATAYAGEFYNSKKTCLLLFFQLDYYIAKNYD
jgi:hypothetical protein